MAQGAEEERKAALDDSNVAQKKRTGRHKRGSQAVGAVDDDTLGELDLAASWERPDRQKRASQALLGLEDGALNELELEGNNAPSDDEGGVESRHVVHSPALGAAPAETFDNNVDAMFARLKSKQDERREERKDRLLRKGAPDADGAPAKPPKAGAVVGEDEQPNVDVEDDAPPKPMKPWELEREKAIAEAKSVLKASAKKVETPAEDAKKPWEIEKERAIAEAKAKLKAAKGTYSSVPDGVESKESKAKKVAKQWPPPEGAVIETEPERIREVKKEKVKAALKAAKDSYGSVAESNSSASDRKANASKAKLVAKQWPPPEGAAIDVDSVGEKKKKWRVEKEKEAEEAADIKEDERTSTKTDSGKTKKVFKQWPPPAGDGDDAGKEEKDTSGSAAVPPAKPPKRWPPVGSSSSVASTAGDESGKSPHVKSAMKKTKKAIPEDERPVLTIIDMRRMTVQGKKVYTLVILENDERGQVVVAPSATEAAEELGIGDQIRVDDAKVTRRDGSPHMTILAFTRVKRATPSEASHYQKLLPSQVK